MAEGETAIKWEHVRGYVGALIDWDPYNMAQRILEGDHGS